MKTTIKVLPGKAVHLPTSNETSCYSRDGNDLVVSDDSTTYIYEDFFSRSSGSSLPVLILPNGDQVAGEAFLQQQSPDMDIETAADKDKATMSSGAGSYEDHTGELFTGVDKLSSLGTTNWDTAASLTEPTLALSLFKSSADGSTIDRSESTTPPVAPDVTPVAPVAPEEVHHVYHANAILGAGVKTASVTMMIQSHNATAVDNPAELSFSYTAGNYFKTPVFDPATGKLTIELTDEGIAARANGEFFDDKLTIVAKGVQYDVYLINPNANTYDSTMHPQTENSDVLISEWYASDGVLKDASISLGGLLGNDVFLESTEQTAISYYMQQTWDQQTHSWIQVPTAIDALVGLQNTTIDGGTNSSVTIHTSNIAEGDQPSNRLSIGIFGHENTDKTTIEADTISITSEINNQYGKPSTTNSFYEETDRILGIANHLSTVELTGSDISVNATTTRDNSLPHSSIVHVTGINSGWMGSTLSSSLPFDPETGTYVLPEDHGHLTLRGKEDTDNTISVSAHVELNQLGGDSTHVVLADALSASRGNTNFLGGNKNDTFVFETTASGQMNGMMNEINAYGIRAHIDDTVVENQRDTKLLIDGGDGHNSLSINVNITASTPPDLNFSSYNATGVSMSHATMSIYNMDEIAIQATIAENTSDPDNIFSAVGIMLIYSDLDISNSESMYFSLSTDGRGIHISQLSTLSIHSDKDTHVRISSNTDGLVTIGDQFYPEGPTRTTISAGENLDLQITVNNPFNDKVDTQSHNTRESVLVVAGIYTAGDGYNATTTIIAENTLYFTVSATNNYLEAETYAIYTELGVHSQVATDSLLLVQGGSGADTLKFDGDVFANGGLNTFILDEGNDSFYLNGNLLSSWVVPKYWDSLTPAEVAMGINTIDLGSGINSFTLTSSLQSNGGINNIIAGDDSNYFTISGGMNAEAALHHVAEWSGGRFHYSSFFAYGENNITTGSGSDALEITGGIHAASGTNSIDTGAGNDTLIISGDLTAQDFSETRDLVITWAEGATPVTFTDEGNSHIIINLGQGNDYLELFGNLSVTGKESNSISIDLGEGNDVLVLHGSTIDGNIIFDGGNDQDTLVYTLDGNLNNLQSLIGAITDGKITGFENLVLDMTDIETQSLDILFENLFTDEITSVFVKGDVDPDGDTVLPLENWIATGNTVTVDDVTYDVYTNQNMANNELMIQQTLVQTFA